MPHKSSVFFLSESMKIWKLGILTLLLKSSYYLAFHDQQSGTFSNVRTHGCILGYSAFSNFLRTVKIKHGTITRIIILKNPQFKYIYMRRLNRQLNWRLTNDTVSEKIAESVLSAFNFFSSTFFQFTGN